LSFLLFCVYEGKKEIAMCIPDIDLLGPSPSEKRAAAAQRQAADVAKREEAEKRAGQKREDIMEALEASTVRRGMRGGRGRRSLFRAGGGGFMGRFD
jgi:hypothetical protein